MSNVREHAPQLRPPLNTRDLGTALAIHNRGPLIETSLPLSYFRSRYSFDHTEFEASEVQKKAAREDSEFEGNRLNDIYERACALEKVMGEQTFFAEAPKALNAQNYNAMTNADLSLLPVPIFQPQKKERLEDAITNNTTGLIKVFPTAFLEKVATGQVPDLTSRGNYIALDSPEKSTQLSHALGIKDMGRVSVDDTNNAIRKNGANALTQLGIQNASLRIVTAEELFLQRRLEGNLSDENVTHTNIRGTEGHLTVNGKYISVLDKDKVGPPPRLAVIFSKDQLRWVQQPKHV